MRGTKVLVSREKDGKGIQCVLVQTQKPGRRYFWLFQLTIFLNSYLVRIDGVRAETGGGAGAGDRAERDRPF